MSLCRARSPLQPADLVLAIELCGSHSGCMEIDMSDEREKRVLLLREVIRRASLRVAMNQELPIEPVSLRDILSSGRRLRRAAGTKTSKVGESESRARSGSRE